MSLGVRRSDSSCCVLFRESRNRHNPALKKPLTYIDRLKLLLNNRLRQTNISKRLTRLDERLDGWNVTKKNGMRVFVKWNNNMRSLGQPSVKRLSTKYKNSMSNKDKVISWHVGRSRKRCCTVEKSLIKRLIKVRSSG